MRALAASVLVLASVLSLSAKSNLQRRILHARYVYVTAVTGDEFSTRTIPQDRNAIAAVQEAIRKWGRYALTYNPANAELIFVVRTGRIVSGHVGGTLPTVGTGPITTSPGGRVAVGRRTTDPNGMPDGPVGPGYGVGGEVGPKDDMLSVFDGQVGTDGAPLWRQAEPKGLGTAISGVPTDVPTLNKLREEVEKAEKEDAAKQKP